MLRRSMSAAEIGENLHQMLPMSASLAGFCVAGIGLLNAQPKTQEYVGLGDDILALGAVIFLACTYVGFWVLRTSKDTRLFALARVVDVLFIAGLTLIVVCGVGIVYAIF